MYRFDPHEDVETSFRAIALDQIDAALAAAGGTADVRSAVHEARRRCKKLRALLKLVRPSFSDYAVENEALRQAARVLAHLRDAEVMQQTIDALDPPAAILEAVKARVDPGPQPNRLSSMFSRSACVRCARGSESGHCPTRDAWPFCRGSSARIVSSAVGCRGP